MTSCPFVNEIARNLLLDATQQFSRRIERKNIVIGIYDRPLAGQRKHEPDLLRHGVTAEEYAQRGPLIAELRKHRRNVINRNAGEQFAHRRLFHGWNLAVDRQLQLETPRPKIPVPAPRTPHRIVQRRRGSQHHESRSPFHDPEWRQQSKVRANWVRTPALPPPNRPGKQLSQHRASSNRKLFHRIVRRNEWRGFTGTFPSFPPARSSMDYFGRRGCTRLSPAAATAHKSGSMWTLLNVHDL